MDRNEGKILGARLSTLCVLRALLRDPVLGALCAHLENPSPAAYAEFVSRLYLRGGDLGACVWALVEESENVYVQALGRGETPPAAMREALVAELDTLQAVTELGRAALVASLDYAGFLPDFMSTPQRLREDYLHRTQHIGRYGYGLYATHRMFCLDETGKIVPAPHPDPIEPGDLIEYERERAIVLQNTRALLSGKPAANILLTGDAGTGKSATVKAVVNALWAEGLRMIEARKDQLASLPQLMGELSGNPLKFIVFLDDLSFPREDDDLGALKAVLEGSVTAKSRNIVLYATSNRRHIVRETFAEREGDEVHRNDHLQEKRSLSDRFGIHLTFSRPNRATYLRIVRHLARAQGLSLPEDELDAQAERFALVHGGRSARLARQFVDELLAR